MAEAKQLSQELCDLAQELAEILQGTLEDSKTSLNELTRILSLNPSTLENNESASNTYASELKTAVSSAVCRCSSGMEKIDDWQVKLLKVLYCSLFNC